MSSIHIQGKDQAILIIHGFTGSPQQLQTYGTKLHQFFSWTIDIPLLPGHGTNATDLSHSNHEQWVKTVDDRLEILLQKHSKVHVMALSMGCLLSILAFKKFPDKISSLVLMAPAMSLNHKLQNVLFRVIAFLPTMPFSFMIKKESTEGMGQTYAEYPFRAVQELSKLAKKTRNILPLSSPPYLLAYSLKDKTIDGPSAKKLAHQLINPNAVVVELKESHHVLPLAKERIFLLDQIVSFYDSLSG